ncbi:MAG: hypothetical protein HY868_13690 [Chloroflexi bacterium]|nr:hypothetical protein [Chloroflexota bacterium]
MDRFAATSFVVSATVFFDTRPGEQGFLSGTVRFVDNSELYFREYVDATDKRIEKVMYTYHYQDAAAQLIFRYDNSAHRPALVSPEHRHSASDIQVAAAPNLEDVLLEIAVTKHWA